MKENKSYNIHIEENYKKENFIILNKKKFKGTIFKSINIPKKSLVKNKICLNNSKLYKSKKFPNNNFLFNIFKLILIMLLYSPVLSLKEIILRKLNYIAEITLIIKGNGDQRILGDGFNKTPSDILVNGINQTQKGNRVYGLIEKINIINLRWDYEFKDCSFMFFNLKNIIEIDLSKFNLQKVTKVVKMFQNCISLTSINLNNFDTSSVEDMRDLFAACISLKSLNLSSFSTKSATNLGQLFYNCSSITSLDLSSFVTSKVRKMNSLFEFCYSLTSLDLSHFDTSKVVDMSSMFKECKSLKILNLDNFKTSSVTDMNRMFASCRVLISLNLKSFDTSSVKNMENMFFSIKALTSLDLSSFNTSSVTNMNKMFNGCSGLISLNLNNFKTSIVENMGYMFNNCLKLISLNIDNFDTLKVKDMSSMFSECPSLISLNLRSFKESSSLTKYNQMFTNNSKLVKYCFIEESIPKIVSDLNNSNPNYINECSDICFKTNQEIKFTESKECVYDCKDSIYNYEYNDMCYNNSCPKGTHSLVSNNYLCEKCNPLTFFNKSCKININDLYEEREILKEIRDELLYGNISNPFYTLIFNTINEEKQDLIIEEDSMVYQLTSPNNQNNNEYYNYSIILLGDCEKKLREHYNINDNRTLIIFKLEYFEEGSLIPIVEYEIYYPYKNEKLNLSICEDIPIDLVIPVTINENEIYKYNLSSDFYNDICFPYTTENGTDIILTDRKNEYYKKNLALCEDNCVFVKYDKRTKKAICQCKVKSTFKSFLDFSFDKDKLLDNIINIKNKINIYVVKCYKLLFSKEGLIKNIGSYILLIIILLNIPLGIIFLFKEYKLLHIQINNIITNNSKRKNKSKLRGSQIYRINKKSQIKLDSNKNEIKGKIKNIPPKRQSQKIDIFVSDSKTNDLINGKSNNNLKLKNEDDLIENKNISQKTFNNKIKGSIANKIKLKKFNDYEINDLTYKKALKLDHRSFKEYYISLLKRKQILIFTFYTNDDYNSKIIKISLLLFSFALYYTINALFFSDSTMHKIYEDKGAFDFIYQIPQILFSSVLSNIDNALISYLSLSEKNLLFLKNTKEKNKENLQKLVYEIKKCLIIKFILFFFFNFFSLILFWYYLGCFCAVYTNTQIHLIKDTLLSFALSLLYPFGLCLLPGIFRIKALNSKNQDKECMYKFSKILQFI